ncbi:MAG: hypothetical protein M1832_002685 [Thelocarpon impressellum]|nr:MAG: hypothetical protein M1832_002685 [Thelocarpon impressellum]
MAFTDDAVLAKLSALNETQESIVTVAQWVLFHKRHAERTAQLWFQRLKDSGANKKLNLMYLANEVVQQSKARRKDDFLIAFSPVIAEASATAYRGATNEVQQKLRRVVEVWRQRQIFEQPIQVAIEARIDDYDKSRSSGKKSLLGSSIFSSVGSSTPAEIQPLVPLQLAVSKIATTKATSAANANQEYEKLTDPTAAAPTPPVHAARLSGLLKSLASAEGAVAESIKARRALIEGLEKILDHNRSSLKQEETQHAALTEHKTAIETKKREVEDGIMRGLAEEPTPPLHGSPGAEDGMPSTHDATSAEPEGPPVEDLSSPSVEALTPTGTPPPPSATEAGVAEEQPASPPPLATAAGAPAPAPGSDLLSSLSVMQSLPSGSSTIANGTATVAKKRKLNDVGGLGGVQDESDAMEGLDDDVAEMLRRESGSYR